VKCILHVLGEKAKTSMHVHFVPKPGDVSGVDELWLQPCPLRWTSKELTWRTQKANRNERTRHYS